MRFATGAGACSTPPFTLKFVLGASPKSRAIYITRVANYPPLPESRRGKQLLFNWNCQIHYAMRKKDWYVNLKNNSLRSPKYKRIKIHLMLTLIHFLYPFTFKCKTVVWHHFIICARTCLVTRLCEFIHL